MCLASLIASRILIGEHSSEPTRSAGAAVATCIKSMTEPPRDVARCVDNRRDGAQISEATAMLASIRMGVHCTAAPPAQNTGWAACYRFVYRRRTRYPNWLKACNGQGDLET